VMPGFLFDYYSKYTFLKATKEATASNVVAFLIKEMFYNFSAPEEVHSDNGLHFRSKIFKEAIKSFGITHLRTPQSYTAERVNRSVLVASRSCLDVDQTGTHVFQ